MSEQHPVSGTSGRRIWIKQPLACFTATDQQASGGLVITGNTISEVLAAGQQPSHQIGRASRRECRSRWSPYH